MDQLAFQIRENDIPVFHSIEAAAGVDLPKLPRKEKRFWLVLWTCQVVEHIMRDPMSKILTGPVGKRRSGSASARRIS